VVVVAATAVVRKLGRGWGHVGAARCQHGLHGEMGRDRTLVAGFG
jgi:hypothetical protein